LSSAIVGIVVGRNGQPLPKVEVAARTNSETFIIPTDDAGQFVLPIPWYAKGKLEVTFSKGGYKTVTQMAFVNDKLNIVMEKDK
jgi:hypothetical protein